MGAAGLHVVKPFIEVPVVDLGKHLPMCLLALGGDVLHCHTSSSLCESMPSPILLKCLSTVKGIAELITHIVHALAIHQEAGKDDLVLAIVEGLADAISEYQGSPADIDKQLCLDVEDNGDMEDIEKESKALGNATGATSMQRCQVHPLRRTWTQSSVSSTQAQPGLARLIHHVPTSLYSALLRPTSTPNVLTSGQALAQVYSSVTTSSKDTPKSNGCSAPLEPLAESK